MMTASYVEVAGSKEYIIDAKSDIYRCSGVHYPSHVPTTRCLGGMPLGNLLAKASTLDFKSISVASNKPLLEMTSGDFYVLMLSS